MMTLQKLSSRDGSLWDFHLAQVSKQPSSCTDGSVPVHLICRILHADQDLEKRTKGTWDKWDGNEVGRDELNATLKHDG